MALAANAGARKLGEGLKGAIQKWNLPKLTRTRNCFAVIAAVSGPLIPTGGDQVPLL